ncbi:MAG: biopolymer transporter ExbD [Prevotellaceae bacterium]|nr:biopolymer transporter ExbD [Prevotellaceae bacterium]
MMAEIQEKDSGGKKGKQKKFNVRVDFTPMVDMNMLLITFFMLCTTMSKPQTMEIAMPRKDVDIKEQEKIKDSRAVTVLLGKEDRVYYYLGMLKTEDYENPEKLVETNFSGDEKSLRALLLGRNREVVEQMKELKLKKDNLEIADSTYRKQTIEIKKNKESPIVMIKATEFATYRNLVDALDEMNICSIGTYAIMDIAPGDLRLLYNRDPQAGYEVVKEEK